MAWRNWREVLQGSARTQAVRNGCKRSVACRFRYRETNTPTTGTYPFTRQSGSGRRGCLLTTSVHVPVSRATYSSASPSLRVSDSKTAGPAFSPPCRRLLSSNAREASEVGTPVAIAGLDLSVEHCSLPYAPGGRWLAVGQLLYDGRDA